MLNENIYFKEKFSQEGSNFKIVYRISFIGKLQFAVLQSCIIVRVARINFWEVRDPKKVDLLDPKSGLTPLNLLQKVTFLADLGWCVAPPHPPWLRACMIAHTFWILCDVICHFYFAFYCNMDNWIYFRYFRYCLTITSLLRYKKLTNRKSYIISLCDLFILVKITKAI